MTDRTRLLLFALFLTVPLFAARGDDASALYAQKCAGCHGDMAHFASRSLCLVDSLPVLRDGGEKLEAFLATHGRLRPAEIETVCAGVTQHLETLPAK